MQRLHKSGWATAMRRLPEEKEEIHMPFPFSVGDPIFQPLLDWVAQPPPTQVRDTHALRFRLLRLGAGGETRNPQFSGLMFFRPQQLGAGPVGSTPGLDGFGSLLVTESVCESLLDPNTAVPPAELVKVFIGFRRQQSGPALVFATLTFMDGDRLQMPTQTFSTVEFDRVEMVGDSSSTGSILMDNPEGWGLLLERTTVLLKNFN
jgi:hypothetical protein